MLSTKNGVKIEADILITNDCNLACKHCLYRNDYRNPKSLTLDEVKKIELFFSDCDVEYHLLGGEPLCNPEIGEITRYLNEIKRYKQILTNGKALDDSILKNLVANGIGAIGFSLDGNKSAHDANRGEGSYDCVMASIDRCRRQSIVPKVSSCVHSENHDTMLEMIGDLSKLGIKRLLFEYFVPFGKKDYPMKMLSKKEWGDFTSGITLYNKTSKMRILAQKVFFNEHEIHPDGCSHCVCTNGQYPVIDAYGNYYPCILFYAVNLKMLNIFQNPSARALDIQQHISDFCVSTYETYYPANKRIDYTTHCPAFLYALSSEDIDAFKSMNASECTGCFHMVERL